MKNKKYFLGLLTILSCMIFASCKNKDEPVIETKKTSISNIDETTNSNPIISITTKAPDTTTIPPTQDFPQTTFESEISKSDDYSSVSDIDEPTTGDNIDKGYVEIESTKVNIPKDLNFGSSIKNSQKKIELNVSSLPNGNYNTNYLNSKDLNGIKVGAYRYKGNSSAIDIYPDHFNYKDSEYEGREGAFYNVSSCGNINSIEVTYSSSNCYGRKNAASPNVTFGIDNNCLDYMYELTTTANSYFNTTAINVSNSNYHYFKINTGDYLTSIKKVVINYDLTTTISPVYESESGKDRFRFNPVRYEGNLVAGKTTVNVPLNIAYSEETKTYSATKSKEFTYYTLEYVKEHPEVKQDASIIDPQEVCIYYTTFGTWPANYSMSGYDAYDVFGSDARKVSKYNRNNGYATSVPWNGNGYYYELDINFDGTYSINSRGTGRVVAWHSGFNAEGYDNSPVCVYTDDHYDTFMEYLNNGNWSSRFNGEGNITGISYSPAKTVQLQDFIKEVTNPEINDINTNNEKVIDDNNYWGNYAPIKVENNETAKYYKVTNNIGINESSKYLIASDSFKSIMLSNYYVFDFEDDTITYSSKNDISYCEIYFKKIDDTSNEYYMYHYDNNNVRYIGYNNSNNNIKDNTKTKWKISFSNGNIIISANNNCLEFNNTLNCFKLNNPCSSSIQLYRYCDCIKDGNSPITDVNYDNATYKKVTSMTGLNEVNRYVIACEETKKILNDAASSDYEIRFNQIYLDEEQSFPLFCFEKDPSSSKYALYVYQDEKYNDNGKIYVTFTNINIKGSPEPVYMDINIIDGTLYIKIEDDSVLFDSKNNRFVRSDSLEKNDKYLNIQLYRLCN